MHNTGLDPEANNQPPPNQKKKSERERGRGKEKENRERVRGSKQIERHRERHQEAWLCKLKEHIITQLGKSTKDVQ